MKPENLSAAASAVSRYNFYTECISKIKERGEVQIQLNKGGISGFITTTTLTAKDADALKGLFSRLAENAKEKAIDLGVDLE